MQRLQLDDQLPGTRFPVVIAAARGTNSSLPVLCVTMVSQARVAALVGVLAPQWARLLAGARSPCPLSPLPLCGQVSGTRGRSFMPLAAVRWPLQVQLAISESLAWRLMELGRRVAAAQARLVGDPRGTTTAADVPIRIRHLTVGNLGLQVSFQGDPLSRPRRARARLPACNKAPPPSVRACPPPPSRAPHRAARSPPPRRDISGGMLSMLIDLANFQAAPITLRGFQMSQVNMLQSQFTAQMLQVAQSQVRPRAPCVRTGLVPVAAAPSPTPTHCAAPCPPLPTATGFQRGPVSGAQFRVHGRHVARAGGAERRHLQAVRHVERVRAARGGMAVRRRGGGASSRAHAATGRAPLRARRATAVQQEQRQARAITDVGEGVLEGASAFGHSILRGFKCVGCARLAFAHPPTSSQPPDDADAAPLPSFPPGA